jgi:hypothetical protein
VNLYGFVGNDGVGSIDAFGLASPECIEAALKALKQAQKILEELLKYDPVEDSKGGHPHAHGITVPGGHYKEIKDLQRGLRNKLRRMLEECDDDDDKCSGKEIPVSNYKTLNELANRQITIPPGIPPLSPGDKPYVPAVPEPGEGLDWDAIEAGAAAAALGALAAGQAGPQVATPEEIITVPVAALIGAAIAAAQ